MPTIRQRLAEFLLGDERRRLEATAGALYNAYLEGPYSLPPEELISQLKEFDSELLYDLVLQLKYDVVGTLGYGVNEELERTRAVDESRRLWMYDVITGWVVDTWTNFGFGENVEIYPEDEDAQEIWNEFWTAERNATVLGDDKLHNISEKVLVDGEFFFVYFINTATGQVTIRTVDAKQIPEILTHPEDNTVKLLYHRQWTVKNEQRSWYYPDWRAYLEEMEMDLNTVELPRGAIRADLQRDGTLVLMQHIAHNRRRGLRGWPLMVAGAPWVRAHRRFREDRASVAAAVAMYVNKLKVKGGSRAVDAVRSRLQSALSQSQMVDTNPPAVAGSTFVENQAAELTRLSLGTGASDAKEDGNALLLMAGLGGGLFPHWLGAGDSYRLATATSMEQPLLRNFSRYQKFWGAQFRNMVKIILWSAETYGNHAPFETYDAEISTDRLIETDLTAISTSLSNLFRSALEPYALDIPDQTRKQILAATWRIVLQAMGVSDADDISSDEAFGVVTERARGKWKKRQARKARANKLVSAKGLKEEVDDEGKFHPRGLPLTDAEKDGGEITAEDVEAAIKAWEVGMPPEFQGIMRAVVKPER